MMYRTQVIKFPECKTSASEEKGLVDISKRSLKPTLNPNVPHRIYKESVYNLFPDLRIRDVNYIAGCCFSIVDYNVMFGKGEKGIKEEYPYVYTLPNGAWRIMYSDEILESQSYGLTHNIPRIFDHSFSEENLDVLMRFASEIDIESYINELLRQNNLFLTDSEIKKSVLENGSEIVSKIKGNIYSVSLK